MEGNAAQFELFDHTADIGVRARGETRGETLADLLQPALDGLYAVIGTLAPAGSGRPWQVALDGDSADYLLHDLLADVLYLFDHEQRVVTDLRILAFADGDLRVAGQSRPLDVDASVLEREVKAVTYHGLEVRKVAGGYEATYIVDI
jgi:SHS2 domain-containing protein